MAARRRATPGTVTAVVCAAFDPGVDEAVYALRDVVRTGFTFQKVMVTISFLLLHKHFHEFVERTHGDPETVPESIAWPKEASPAAVPAAAAATAAKTLQLVLHRTGVVGDGVR